MDKNEVAKRIQKFLTEKGFVFGMYGTCGHRVGIDYACALVRPNYSPIDGTYTITVDPVSIKGWVCRMPYAYSSWECIWQKPYSTHEELAAILTEAIDPPVGCWGNKWKESRFQIDGGPVFNGYTTGQHWNGWAMPYFTLEVGLEITKSHGSDEYPARYDEATDTFVFEMGEDGPDLFKGQDIDIDGQILHLYPIGAGYWIWDDLAE